MCAPGYKSLIAWQKADKLAKQIYVITKGFPRTEIFGITSQLRRSALSVPTNIVEGYSRGGKKEFKRFLSIALGSLAETEYLIDFSLSLQFFSLEDYCRIRDLRSEVGKLLWRLYKASGG